MPASAFLPASYCAACHQDIHRQWRESAHANSFREPFYLRNVELLNNTKGIESSRHCEGCHNPVALFSGALTTGSKIERPFDEEGVTCTVCHSIRKIQNTSGTGSYAMGTPAALVKPDGTPVPGPVDENQILSNLDLHKRAVMQDFYRTPEFCAVCHKAAVPKALNNYRWLRAFTVYDEWQESSWSKQTLAPFYTKPAARSCQSCHMMPEAAHQDYAEHDGTVKSHRWLGANTAIPTFYHYPEQLKKTAEFLKDTVSIDIFALNKNNGPLIAPVEKQQVVLQRGDVLTISVVLQNTGIGHSLVPEQRDFYQSWVEFEAKDAAGNQLCRSGTLDARGHLDSKAHTYTNRLVSAKGKWLDLHEVWETRIRAYDNTILPGRSDLVRYRFTIPAEVSGPITLTARLNYRRFRQGYTNFVLKNRPRYPVVEMASRTLTLTVRDKKGTSSSGIATPDYLRWNNYGIALLGEIQYYKAAEAFRQVVALNPRYADGYTNIAIATYTELIDHKREGADGLGENGLAAGGTPDGTGNLFLPRAADASFEPALQALDRALALEPGNLRAQFHKAVISRLLKRFDVAIALLKPVVDAYPRFRQARQELGYAYYVSGQYSLAREQFEALQAINPDDITANNYLSYVYSKLGLKEKAAAQAALFVDRKEDVEVEPLAQDFWSKNEDVTRELAPFHIHDVPIVTPADRKSQASLNK
ncbi:MAG TPA: tetratricopeptide repeat protein [Candidatus Angelobacter sp.]|nr:tetratricopeptide repeat protein [Candidatus Angelobacter sp.]